MVRSRKELAGAPLLRRRRRQRPSGPPERLFGFVGDIAPGPADVVQLAVRPFAQFLARAVALPPDMESIDHLRKQAWSMMIYHRFVGVSGHVRLLQLICCC